MKDNFLKVQNVVSEVGKVVVGQDLMIKRLLMGHFTNGHILLEGVPGLAKTLTVNTLANVLKLNFNRIQFTPDLLPSDVIGTMIYNQKRSSFEVKKGEVFAIIGPNGAGKSSMLNVINGFFQCEVKIIFDSSCANVCRVTLFCY